MRVDTRKHRRRLWETRAAEFGRFLGIAMGSASELEYHLILSRDLHLLPSESYETLTSDLIEVKRMLVTLSQKLKADG